MRKALLIGTALAALVTAPALAEMREYYRAGGWASLAGTLNDGEPSCAMQARARDFSWSVMVKYYGNNGAIGVQLAKRGWRIPSGTNVQVELGFDSTPFGDVAAYGRPVTREPRMGLVQFTVAPDSLESFLEGFREAKKMWVTFPNGNEPAWVLDMTGSRENSNAFAACILRLANARPTQPYGNQPTTQPYQAPREQPRKPGDRAA